MASPLFVERRGEVARLLNEVDRLSERLHDEFATITEADYAFFGRELGIVIATLKALRKDSLLRPELRVYDARMQEQISDLEELDYDIREFRVNAAHDESLQKALEGFSSLDFSKYAV